MNATKIQFSKQEIELVQNAAWILTKNGIIEKIGIQFAHLSAILQSRVISYGNSFPATITPHAPKISRGEKLEGLPYMVLDYPRLFLKEEIAAVRNLFWWGHFFSSALHVRGRYAEKLLIKLGDRNMFQNKAIYYTIGSEEWRHDLKTDQVALLHTLSNTVITQHWEQHRFIKIVMVFPLQEWQQAPERMKEASFLFLDMLKD